MLTLEEKVNCIRELHVPLKRQLLRLILAIKRDHPELPDAELENLIFPPYEPRPVHPLGR